MHNKKIHLGIIFCASYALFILVCVLAAYYLSLAGYDMKSQYLLLSLPLTLQVLLLDTLGLGVLITSLSWLSIYSVLSAVTGVLLYYFGKWLDSE